MEKPIKIGIEIEYLIMKKNGKGVNSGFQSREGVNPNTIGLKILKSAAKSIDPTVKITSDRYHCNIYKLKKEGKDFGVMLPDTFSLLETVTTPSSSLNKLGRQLWTMKKALIDAAAKYNCLLSGSACPIGFTYDEFSPSQNNTFNNAGMHIHLDAPTDKIKVKLANMIIQIIPELTALSVNSPVYAKKISKYKSKRLATSDLINPKNVEVLTVPEYNPLQFDDPSKRYRFVTQFTKSRRTIEIRGFDTPITIDWAIALAALIQCLAEKSKKLYISEKRDTIVSAKRKFRLKNFQTAVRAGINAKFIIDPTFHIRKNKRPMSFLYHDSSTDGRKKTSAYLAIKRLLYYVEEEVERLGYYNFLQPIYDAVRKKENQATLQLKWFKHSYLNYFKKLTEASKKPWIKKGKTLPTSKYHYFLVRQRDKTGDDQHIDISPTTINQLGLADENLIYVSGPLESIKLKVHRDQRSESRMPLDKNEIGLGRVNRKKLGVSIYDPVILGKIENKPSIIRKCGTEWTESPSLKSQTLNICMGFKEYGIGYACISTKILKNLNLKAEDLIVISSKKSRKSIKLKIKPKDELREDYIALMKRDRESLEAEIDDVVTIKKGKDHPHEEYEVFKMRFVVRKGSRTDLDDSIILRLNPNILKELGLEEGDHVMCYTLKDTEKRRYGKGVVRSSENTNLNLKKNEVGIRSAARKKIGVALDDTISLGKCESSN